MSCLELMDFAGKDGLLRSLSKAMQERELAMLAAAQAPMPELKPQAEIPAPPPHMP